MHPIRIDRLGREQYAEPDHANRTAKDGRLRIRALIVLLAAERGLVAADIAAVSRVRQGTVRRWLARYRAEGRNGPAAVPRPGAAPKATRRDGLGAANWHTGATVVLLRRRTRRREIAELLQALVGQRPHERVYAA